MSTAEWITAAIVGFFALLALLVFLRLLFRQGPPDWIEYRVGFYVSRVPKFDDEEDEEIPASEMPTQRFER